MREAGVKSLKLFGSVVRGEARPESDIDILVEFSRPIGLLAFVRLKQRLTELLGRPVDLVTPEALKPPLRDGILHEAKMPVRDWKFRIADMLEAVQNSLEITRGMDYETFSQDKKTLKAVLYNLAVIGEAARKVPAEIAHVRNCGDGRNAKS